MLYTAKSLFGLLNYRLQAKLTLKLCIVGFKKRFGDLLDYDPEEEIAKFKASTNPKNFI